MGLMKPDGQPGVDTAKCLNMSMMPFAHFLESRWVFLCRALAFGMHQNERHFCGVSTREGQ